jgi:ribonuclease P protein component
MACGKPRVPTDETYVSAEQTEASPDARFSCPHGDQGRPPRSEEASGQRPRETDTVTHHGRLSRLVADSRYRLRKHNRLLDARQYGRVFKKAARSRDKWFTVLSRDNNKDVASLGLAIARKHCRQATDRNRLKRVVRESFRQNQHKLVGLDIVVINEPAAAGAANGELFASLDGHWDRCRAASPRGSEQE